ncbi:MAG: N-acetyltransferase GCN5 [Bacteroidetes bacterium]|nr:MAG: N-acetyltransferase GCN5 [Bacteroidota bacterium]
MQTAIGNELVVRDLRSSDSAAFLYMIRRNQERLRNSFPLILSKVNSKISALSYVREKVAEIRQKTFHTCIVEHTPSKILVGYISMKNMDFTVPKAELAYFIDAEFEGKGIGSRAVGAVCDFAFAEIGMNKLFMRISPANPASRRLAEKCGFEKEGLIRADFKTSDGELLDVEYWGKVKN